MNAGEAGNGTGEAAGTPLFAGHEAAPCPADANRGHSGRAGWTSSSSDCSARSAAAEPPPVAVGTVGGVSYELWEWWEGRLTRLQRTELIAFGREALPAELARDVQRAAADLPVTELTPSREGPVWHLSEVAVRFVGDRQHERDHPDDDRPAGSATEVHTVYSAAPVAPALIELLHTADCPSWVATAVRLSVALQVTGRADVQVEVEVITSPEQSAQVGFTGSPMIRFDGIDPFAEPGLVVGLSCRLYRDGADLVDAPTVGQLVDALLACERPQRVPTTQLD